MTTVVLGGELDQASAPALRDALDEALSAGTQTFLFDLGDVTFIDSTMLGVVVYAATRAERLVVLCPEPELRQLFEMVGLDRVFPVVTERGAALHALAGEAEQTPSGADSCGPGSVTEQ